MPVISNRAKLAYFDVPKVACTSLKTLFWEIETGRPFPSRAYSGLLRRLLMRLGYRPPGIHREPNYETRSFFAAQPVPAGYETMVVIRDPIDRLYSAWKDKGSADVLRRNGGELDLRNEGLPVQPEFGTYVERLSHYREVSRPVRTHTHPLAWHLGPRLDAFDHVFRIEELGSLAEFLSRRLGRPVRVPHLERTKAPVAVGKLNPIQVEALSSIVAPDYAWLGGAYDFQRSVSRFA
jgi:Sulfotransferase family